MVQVLLCLPGSAIPGPSWAKYIPLDKLVHLVMFGGMAYLWCRYLLSGKAGIPAKQLLWVLIMVIANGVMMEFVQKYYIPLRSFDIWDIAADTLGAYTGYWWAKKRKWRR
jgi:VanZ family protein